MKPVLLIPDYAAFLTEVKSRIQSARLTAGRAVNRELVLLYWDIGRGIVEKQTVAGWGEGVVERLAADLRAEFPDMRGFLPSTSGECAGSLPSTLRRSFSRRLCENQPLAAPARARQFYHKL